MLWQIGVVWCQLSILTHFVSLFSNKPAVTSARKTATSEPVQVHQWSTLQQEKARVLFAKYGLTLEPGEWMSKPADRNVQRVEKPVRMRIRRNCHRCLTTFGADKVCAGCQHLRCKKCFRYPPAKPKDECHEKDKSKATGSSKKPVLTIPSRTGGQDLVRKPIRQRVRRTCHRCQALFVGDATVCGECEHIRCKKCPRDPYVFQLIFNPPARGSSWFKRLTVMI